MAPWEKTITTRCRYFDEKGQPVKKGCLSGPKCRFLHPDDPGWEKGKTRQQKQPRYGLGPSNYHEHHKGDYIDPRTEYEYSRWPSGSKSRPRLSESPKPSRHPRDSRSPGEHSRRRRDSGFEASRGDPYETERGRRRRGSHDDPEAHKYNRQRDPSPPSSIASSRNEPSHPTAPLPAATTNVLPTPPTSSEHPELAAQDMARSFATPSHPPASTHATHVRQDSISMPPPPPPETPPPPPPGSASYPHTMPALPHGLTLDIKDPTIPELSPEEKVALWQERTKILAESALAYEQYKTLDEEYEKAVKATETRFFNSLPDEDKKRLSSQVDALLSRSQGAQKTYQKLTEQLRQTSSWPIAPVQPSSEEKEIHLALVKDVTELRDTVDKVKNSLGEIHRPPPQLFLAGNDSDEEEESRFMPNESSMDIDLPSRNMNKKIPLPSRKRPRMDDSLDDTIQIKPAQPSEEMPTKKELEDYHDKLIQYQETLASLWDHCHRRDVDQLSDFKHEVQEKIDTIQQKRAKQQQVRDVEREKQETARKTKIDEMNEQIKDDGTDIAGLSTHISDLVRDVDRLQVEVQMERRARDENYQRMLQVEQKLKSYTDAQQANAATLETLKTALRAYTTRPPSPPMSPRVPPPSYLMQSLEQPLIDSLRESIRPVIGQLREDVEKLVNEKNAQLFATVWKRVSTTLTALSLIQSRMDAEPPQAAPPAS